MVMVRDFLVEVWQFSRRVGFASVFNSDCVDDIVGCVLSLRRSCLGVG